MADDPIGIDLEDVLCSVSVQIPTIVNACSGDRLVVCWGRERLAAVTLGDPHESGFPLDIGIPRRALMRVGSGLTKVFYELHRGDFVLTSSAIRVMVDIEVPGPRLQHFEGRENPALSPALVRGARSGYDDEITPADVGRPVNVTIPFYDGAEIDDLIRLYWGQRRIPVAEYRVTRSDLEQRHFAPLPVEWACVELEGNALDTPVCYSLGSPHHGNESPSPVTPVNVHFAVPGGPAELGEVEILGLNERGWLVPGPETRKDVRLKVPPYRNMAVGDVIRLQWRGFDSPCGAGGEIPGTAFGPVELIVEERHLGAGLELTMDFSPWVRDTLYGAALVRYSVACNGVVHRGPVTLVKVDTRGAPGH